jgi:hypothetical protein
MSLTIDGNALPYTTGMVLYDSLTIFKSPTDGNFYIKY